MTQSIVEFFDTMYGQITLLAGVIATLWGLFKGFGALRKWLQKYAKQKLQKKQFPSKIMNAVAQLKKVVQIQGQQIQKLTQSVNKINNNVDTIVIDINTINSQILSIAEQLKDNGDCTASVMLQRMMQAYHFYVIDKKPIPLDIQTSLCVMYDHYKKNKLRNHVPQDFKQRIKACEVIG